MGNVIALLTCGELSKSGLGWPGSFYTWGGIAFLWAVVFLIFGKDSPADHPNIPLDEKEYIEVSLGVTETEEVRASNLCYAISIKYIRNLNFRNNGYVMLCNFHTKHKTHCDLHFPNEIVKIVE